MTPPQPASTSSDSPLKQVNLNDQLKFKPKILTLYDVLFSKETHPPGYWVEFFLLPVNKPELSRILKIASPLSNHKQIIRTLVSASIANLSLADVDDLVQINALGVLETVFTEVLHQSKSAKGLQSPSTAAISILVGIDQADKKFDELSSAMLNVLQHSDYHVTVAMVNFMLNLARVAQGTSLVSLLTSRNFFSALVRVISTCLQHKVAVNAFVTLGLITMLNIYDDDMDCVYLQRINEFVDEDIMIKMVALVQRELLLPSAPKRGVVSKLFFFRSNGDMSGSVDTTSVNWELLLPVYFFTVQNEIFASLLASSPSLASIIECGSYSMANQLTTNELYSHSWLITLILRKLVETQFDVLLDSQVQTDVRIYDENMQVLQRRRTLVNSILEFLQYSLKCGGVKQKHVDLQLVDQLVILTYQVCVQLIKSNPYIQYSWTPMWGVLFALLKHFTKLTGLDTTNVIELVCVVLAGMCAEKHLNAIDELDWNTLVFHIVQTPELFDSLQNIFPKLTATRAMVSITAMIAEYKKYDTEPNLDEIARRGVTKPPLLSELKRQFNDNTNEFRKIVHGVVLNSIT